MHTQTALPGGPAAKRREVKRVLILPRKCWFNESGRCREGSLCRFTHSKYWAMVTNGSSNPEVTRAPAEIDMPDMSATKSKDSDLGSTSAGNSPPRSSSSPHAESAAHLDKVFDLDSYLADEDMGVGNAEAEVTDPHRSVEDRSVEDKEAETILSLRAENIKLSRKLEQANLEVLEIRMVVEDLATQLSRSAVTKKAMSELMEERKVLVEEVLEGEEAMKLANKALEDLSQDVRMLVSRVLEQQEANKTKIAQCLQAESALEEASEEVSVLTAKVREHEQVIAVLRGENRCFQRRLAEDSNYLAKQLLEAEQAMLAAHSALDGISQEIVVLAKTLHRADQVHLHTRVKEADKELQSIQESIQKEQHPKPELSQPYNRERTGTVMEMRGNGDCLFAALALGCGKSAAEVRRELSSFLLSNATSYEADFKAMMGGESLEVFQAWAEKREPTLGLYSEYMKVLRHIDLPTTFELDGQEYNSFEVKTNWGGELEMQVYQDLTQQSVDVYREVDGKFRLVTSGKFPACKQPVALVFRGDHYDYLALDEP